MNKFNLFSKDYDHEHMVNQLVMAFIIVPAIGCVAIGAMTLPAMVAQGVAAEALGIERVR